jgi:hypothetical protein
VIAISVSVIFVLLLSLAGFALLAYLRRRNMLVWLPAYLRAAVGRPPLRGGPIHVIFCFVDHFEPRWRGANYALERARMARWCAEYPHVCDGHLDADGRSPQHTYFFPEEEYRPEHIRDLVQLCRVGGGEIEVHLHHDDDTDEGLRSKLRRFTTTLVDEFGALPVVPETGRAAWAFIHGNWALDNSRPDGHRCGVNNELLVLADEGCYADFTLPSAPDVTQTRTINSIYYATDDPVRAKSHDTGIPVRVGGTPEGDLMIVQGPLGLNWRWRKFGILPRVENGDVSKTSPPRRDRTDLWVRTGIHVEGRPEWTFVKVHTHGLQEQNMEVLLGQEMDELFSDLETRYNDGKHHVLHYVTAREMYNIIKAAEAGCAGNPNTYRNYIVPAPSFVGAAAVRTA